jgi:aminopeptidase N
MFDHALGKDVWQKGMQKYMRMKSLSYATPNDLHMAMQEAINETKKPKYMKINVSKAMLSWETQAGYPIIHVSRKKSGILSFEQKQFIPDENETNEKIWQIPISYYSSKSPSFESTLPQIWMKTNIITPLISPMNESDWIIVNTQQTGYYRVSYDDHLWRNIMELLDKDPTKIHKFNRAQLIDDSFELAKLGQIPFENHLRVLEYLKHEDQYVPWLVANDSYEFILRNLRNNSLALESVSAQIRKNIKKFLARLKFYVIPNEPITDRLGRKLAIELACNHHSEICLLETRERLKNSIFKNEILEPELSNPVTCHGMRLADEDFFEVIVDIMLRETDNKERLRY